MIKLVVAVLVAVGSVLTTLSVSSCGSTWRFDTDLKMETSSPQDEEVAFMLYNAYSIKDMIDGTFGDILLARSDERCKRTFLDQVARRNRQLKEQGFPEVNLNEYQLWRIGTFEDTNGRLSDNNGMMDLIPLV